MATLYLMVGLPCAGKTTLARELEQEYAALRLTPDDWQTRLFGHDAEDEEHDTRHSAIEAMLWDVAARALELGVNVILDFGFWAQVEREDYRGRAAQLGASSEIRYVKASEEALLERLKARNAAPPPGAIMIPEESLERWVKFFQAPTPDELERRE